MKAMLEVGVGVQVAERQEDLGLSRIMYLALSSDQQGYIIAGLCYILSWRKDRSYWVGVESEERGNIDAGTALQTRANDE